jgi:N-acetylmuramoyl-L-alanine amidase
VSVALALGAVTGLNRAQTAAQTDGSYTVLTREGRRPLAVRRSGGLEMVMLDDLAGLFGLTVREDALAGGITVTRQGQTVVLSPGQALASVGGRVISLPAPATREGRSWLVPIEIVSRALGPLTGQRIDLRKPTRLVVVGDLRVPRVTQRFDTQGGRARITLDVEPPTPYRVTQDGRRLLLAFEADALDARLSQPETGSIVNAIRPGDAPTALVVDLGPSFVSYAAADVPTAEGPVRIVIDLVGQPAEPAPRTPTAPAPSAPPGAPAAEVAAAPALAQAEVWRTIAIDPGHGGDEAGARGASGALEKEVTLSVARRLKAAIEGRLGVRVLLTRDADVTVSLDERAARANNNKADLFVSLHANASPSAAASGAEVFSLSLDEYGSGRAARAESPSAPVFGGGTRPIELIPWEMAQTRHITQSTALAAIIEEALRRQVPMSPRAMQQAPFRVLVGANMPAVLVEMGFMTNGDDEQRLVSDQYQNTIAQALVDSILRFRDRLRTDRRD